MSYLLSPPFDRPPRQAKVLQFLRSKALRDGGYSALDEATRREALLDKLWQESPASSEVVYHALRMRLRLALALAKVAVARRMASPKTKSYCIQAMESGIDCMRDAARELEALEKQVQPGPNEVSSAQLWEFHRKLLGIWDTAKKRDDTSVIRAIDLEALAGEILRPTKAGS
ncbi:MAG: hypothetical protein Q7T82_13735 [Armatimonadota bacterium]|nr:hypothetical protein [Armatimonadota bacterium]